MVISPEIHLLTNKLTILPGFIVLFILQLMTMISSSPHLINFIALKITRKEASAKFTIMHIFFLYTIPAHSTQTFKQSNIITPPLLLIYSYIEANNVQYKDSCIIPSTTQVESSLIIVFLP